jgi:hypothetical protein
MSDERDTHDIRDAEEGAPMLVLGEDRDDVEDTTAEELARQREELEERRRRLEDEARIRREEAEAEADRLRREAEEKLAEERRLAEVELARRQREIDEAERRLYRTERRLRKKAQASGGHVPDVSSGLRRSSRTSSRSGPGGRRRFSSLLAAAERRSSVPVPRMGRAALLSLAATGLVVVGAVTSVDPPAPEAVEDFVTMDEARVAWLETGITLDGEVVRYLGGEDVTQDDGSLTSVTQATEASLTTGDSYNLRSFEEVLPPLLSEPGTNPQRVLSAWVESRRDADYAAPTYEIDDVAETLDSDRVFPTLLLMGGLLSVAGLAFVLARGGSRVGAGLAGLALVPVGMLIADQDRHLDVEPALTRHEDALDGASDIYDLLGRDLETVHGTRVPDSYERETYWEGLHYLDEELLPVEPAAVYTAAREALDGVDTRALTLEESLPYAERLLADGSALLEAQHEELSEAREAVVAMTSSDVDLGRYVPLTAAAALLPLAALVPAALRRREVDR